MHPTVMLSCYCPQTKFAKVMFLQVSVCPQEGCLPHCMLGHTPWQVHPREGTTPSRYTPTTPRAGTPPWQVHPRAGTPPGRYTPKRGTPHRQVHPPAQCMLGYGQQAGGTHPTGMQSCLKCKASHKTERYNFMLFVD